MTLDELVTAVKGYLNMPNTSASSNGKPDNDTIKRAINQVAKNLHARITTGFGRRLGTSTTLSYTADSESLALPSAAQLQHVFRVEAAASGSSYPYDLDPMILAEFRNVSRKGTPRYFAIQGTSIFLRPIPTSAYTLTIWYVAGLTTLSGGSDTPSWLPDRFHDLIAVGAALRLRKVMEDPSQGLESLWDEEVREMDAWYFSMVKDNHVHETESAEDFYG